MNNRERYKFIEENPQPTDMRTSLAHTLKMFEDAPDDRFVLVATSGTYGNGVRTGLTVGDLREIARVLHI